MHKSCNNYYCSLYFWQNDYWPESQQVIGANSARLWLLLVVFDVRDLLLPEKNWHETKRGLARNKEIVFLFRVPRISIFNNERQHKVREVQFSIHNDNIPRVHHPVFGHLLGVPDGLESSMATPTSRRWFPWSSDPFCPLGPL